ncbi:MAG TPA: hypothetical protein GX701_04875 [Clostridiales bacterium]|nr:hypothetical protein [Clostridiales bacterium]
MKKWYAAITVCFIIPLFFLTIWAFFDKDAVFSQSENRKLAEKPTISLQKLLSGDFSSIRYVASGNFTKEFEKYYTDTFPFRERLLLTSGVVNRLYYISLGGKTTIIEGGIDHNWEGGGQNIFDMTDIITNPPKTNPPTTPRPTEPATTPAITTPEPTTTVSTPWKPVTHPEGTIDEPNPNGKPVDTGAIVIIDDIAMEHYYGVDSMLLNYANAITRLKNALPDVNVYALFCPTSIEFNAPSAYQAGIRSQLRAMNFAYENLGTGVIPVDVWSPLYYHKTEYLYFRTDHHWTQRGAYYAYTSFAKAAGFTPYEIDSYAAGEIPGFLGTMYTYTKNVPQSVALKNNPDTVEFFLPQSNDALMAMAYADGSLTNGRPVQVVYEDGSRFPSSWKYGIFLGGDHPIVHIQNNQVQNGKKLLVTKESYGNALIPFLVDHYEEVFVIDPREFNGSGKPSLDLPAFALAHGVTDIACVNYSFSATGSFMNIFNKMIP